MDNRKYNCKKKGETKALHLYSGFASLQMQHYAQITYLQPSTFWRFIRKYTQSNYTIYRVNYSETKRLCCESKWYDNRKHNADMFSQKLVQHQIQEVLLFTNLWYTTLGTVF